VRRGSPIGTAARELEMSANAWDRKEHSVVAVVVAKPADLGQADAVPVKRDDLIESFCVPGDAKVHVSVECALFVDA
jgi:hypothetical protein